MLSLKNVGQIFRHSAKKEPKAPPKVIGQPAGNLTQNPAQNPSTPYTARERAILGYHAQTLAVLLFNAGIAVKTIQPARGAKYTSLAVRLLDPLKINKALGLSESLAVQVATERVIALRERGHAIFQVGLHQSLWKDYTRADLHTPNGIGFAARKREMKFDLTQESPHVYFVGATGSGKSEGIKTSLYGLMQLHPPDTMKIVIADPHHDYAQFANAAHLAAPIAAQTAAINDLVQWVVAELAHRKEADARRSPKLVFVVDELAELTDPNENPHAAKNRAAIDAISNGGRKYNVHLMIGIQRPNKNNLPKKTNFTRRFIGYLPDGNESYIVGGQAGLKANALTGQGDFVMISASDAKRFQFVMLSTQDFNAIERAPTPPLSLSANINPQQLAQAVTSSGNGRPRNDLLPEVLGLVMANSSITYPQAKKAVNSLNSKYHLQTHKRFWNDALNAFLTIKGLEATQ